MAKGYVQILVTSRDRVAGPRVGEGVADDRRKGEAVEVADLAIEVRDGDVGGGRGHHGG